MTDWAPEYVPQSAGGPYAEDQAAVVADRAVGVPAVAVGQVVVAVVDGVDAESTMPLVV